MSDLIRAFAQHRDDLIEAAAAVKFIVFLCGPASKTRSASAKLRTAIKRALLREGFDVVIGEDDGINAKELTGIGINAQDSELEFIRRNCNAVVIIADSVGSFCELGLFSWHFVHQDGVLNSRTDCIVLVNAKYKADKSYLNLGPAAAVNGFGRLDFVDFGSFTPKTVVDRLKAQRGVYAVDNRRGRPRSAPK